jgi:hypothetical protein
VDHLIRWFLHRRIKDDLAHDVAVWENKQHLEKPVLVKTDGKIMQFRKWHSQFYGSP